MVSATPDVVDNCTTIDQSGRYELQSDIVNASASCFDITADDVVFDGNGHRVDGTSRGVGIAVQSTNVTIRNVSVSNWYHGISVSDATDIAIENVTVRENNPETAIGLFVLGSENVTVSDSLFTKNREQTFITKDSSKIWIYDNEFRHTPLPLEFFGVTTGVARNNTIVGGAGGFNIEAGHSYNFTIADNEIRVTHSVAIDISRLHNSTIEGNTVVNDYIAIQHSRGSNNVIRNNRIEGGSLSHVRGRNTTIRGNTFTNISGGAISAMGVNLRIIDNHLRNITLQTGTDNAGITLLGTNVLARANTYENVSRPIGFSDEAVDSRFVDAPILRNATVTATGQAVNLMPWSDPAPPPRNWSQAGVALRTRKTNWWLDSFVQVTLQYDDGVATKYDESNLSVWRYGGQWQRVTNATVDPATNTVHLPNTTAMGKFAVFAPAAETEPPPAPLAINLNVPERPTVDEPTPISAEVTVPDVIGRHEAELAVTVYVDHVRVHRERSTVTDGQTITVNFTQQFWRTGEAEVSADAAITLRGAAYSANQSETVDVVRTRPEITGPLLNSISVPATPVVGENATTTVETSVPEFAGATDGQLTVRLLVDGSEMASKTVTVQTNETTQMAFETVFESAGVRTVTANSTLVVGNQSAIASATRTVNVSNADTGGPFDGVVSQYNTDGDSTISIAELGSAATDYARGKLRIAELGQVAQAYARL